MNTYDGTRTTHPVLLFSKLFVYFLVTLVLKKYVLILNTNNWSALNDILARIEVLVKANPSAFKIK